jgi:hypothetical protein
MIKATRHKRYVGVFIVNYERVCEEQNLTASRVKSDFSSAKIAFKYLGGGNKNGKRKNGDVFIASVGI